MIIHKGLRWNKKEYHGGKNNEAVRELSDFIRKGNIKIMSFPEGKKVAAEILLKEIIQKNFLNLEMN